jgi:hypothetical protein
MLLPAPSHPQSTAIVTWLMGSVRLHVVGWENDRLMTVEGSRSFTTYYHNDVQSNSVPGTTTYDIPYLRYIRFPVERYIRAVVA